MFVLKDLLTQNELRIFQAVYETGPVSRIRIARGLNLTRAAVSVNIKRLKDLGLIAEVGKGISTERRGRREVLLDVNPDTGIVISIHFSLNSVSFGLTDLGGKILDLDQTGYQIGASPQQVLPSLIRALKSMLSKNEIDKEKVFGVGVAIPGIVSYQSSSLGETTLSGWQGFPLRSYLQEELDCEVFIENDVKTLTLGEFQFGTSRDVSNLVCLWLENGIGAGLMIEGRLIRGATASAGEIGFNEFFPEIPLKQSIFIEGQPKCWGDVLSFANIRNSIKRGIKEGWKTTLKPDAKISDFIQAVETGDPLALFIIQIIGKVVSTVCRNLVYTFNPQTLVMSGRLFHQLPMLADEIRRYLKNSSLKKPMEAVEIKTSILGQNGMIIGAVALVLEHLFRTSEQKSMHSNTS